MRFSTFFLLFPLFFFFFFFFANHGGVDLGVLLIHKVEGRQPLEHDQEAQIAKQGEHQQDLRDKLKEEIQIALKVQRVQHLHENTQTHMNHTETAREKKSA